MDISLYSESITDSFTLRGDRMHNIRVLGWVEDESQCGGSRGKLIQLGSEGVNGTLLMLTLCETDFKALHQKTAHAALAKAKAQMAKHTMEYGCECGQCEGGTLYADVVSA